MPVTLYGIPNCEQILSAVDGIRPSEQPESGLSEGLLGGIADIAVGPLVGADPVRRAGRAQSGPTSRNSV